MSRGQSDEFQEAIETLDMETWLEDNGVTYRPTRGSRGPQYNVKECPFCGNANWKVYMNQDTGAGNCFHGDCEKKFGKWAFIKAQLGEPESRVVVDHIVASVKAQGWRPKRKAAVAVDVNAGPLTLPRSIELPHNGRNLKYLDNRGITAELTKYFSLRFSLNGRFEYLDDDGRKRGQDYSNRVIIPIFDLYGDLVSFQGRDTIGTAEKKYLFPPGFASTGSVLYNGHNAWGVEELVIGEGVFDVAAIKAALDGDVATRHLVPVGTFGKHLSFGDESSQLAKLMALKAAGLQRVTFMWDGELKAIKDAIEAALMVRKYGIVARVAILPKDRDPNEVAPSVVRDAYWKATPINQMTAAKLLLQLS